jgi:hypothetical protein
MWTDYPWIIKSEEIVFLNREIIFFSRITSAFLFPTVLICHQYSSQVVQYKNAIPVIVPEGL